MDGATAQTAALIIAGNHRLRGGDITGFWPDAPVFKFCKNVEFSTLSGPQHEQYETPYADNPLLWLEKQGWEKVVGFRLTHMPVNDPMMSDRMGAGFVGGGGRKILEAVKADEMAGWEAGWRVQDQNDPEQKIWHVTYRRIGTLPRRDVIPLHPVGLTRMLQDALVDIAVFAKKHEYASGWVETFDKAMMALKSDTPLAASFNFKNCEAMVPDVRAQRLLAAADIGWVFGAMGSWNDMSFEGEAQQEYEKISDRLFGLMIDAIVTSVNSTFQAADKG